MVAESGEEWRDVVEKEVSKIDLMIAFFDCGGGSFLGSLFFFLLKKKRKRSVERASEVFGHMIFS